MCKCVHVQGTRVRTLMCVLVCTRVPMWGDTCARLCVREHACAHVGVHTSVCCVRVLMRPCAHMYVHAHACRSACVHICLHTEGRCVHVYVHMC